jgi:cellulose synthase/poly-beta-1,6-N-acetylglucosamine synthase-like glycosyltransferase
MNQNVTVIATVLNEADTIVGLLESLARQTRRPDAIIIVDGGSTDPTLTILRRWEAGGELPLRVIEAPGTNIAQGRNIAISAAETGLIAGTDAGTHLAPDWLHNLMVPFEQGPSPDVVAGFFIADPHTIFETALGATTLPVIDDVQPDHFLPSSRSIAFRKSVWENLGGYPEWIDSSEDLLFDLWLRQDGYRIAFAPNAMAYFRPRQSLRQFFQQYYHYARGDGQAGLWPIRHAIRYLTYLIAMPFLLWMAICDPQSAIRNPSLARLALIIGVALMFRPPLQRLWRMTRGWGWGRRLQALAWIPIIRVTGDVAKMLGYPAGCWWHWQHRAELRDVRGRPPFRLSRIFDRS